MSHIQQLYAQGFDRSEVVPFESRWRVRCSQCEALCINGIPCHETGCPNVPRPESDDLDDSDLDTGD